jgi:hypothetical protein
MTPLASHPVDFSLFITSCEQLVDSRQPFGTNQNYELQNITDTFRRETLDYQEIT